MKARQVKNHFPSPYADNGWIIIPSCSLKLAQARQFADLIHAIINCNVAKFTPVLSSLWDELKSPDSQTIEVDAKVLSDLQRLAKIGDNLEESILELIRFYENPDIDSLNIILQPDVLSYRISYAKFTAQFAHTISKSQSSYPHIKVLFDTTTSRLGIFCKRFKTSAPNFITNLITQLKNHSPLLIEDHLLPKTYKTNLAMLKQHLKKKTPENEFEINSFNNGILVDFSSKHAKV